MMERPNNLYRWVYVSRHSCSGRQLELIVGDIVDLSVSRNHSLRVTGALLCSETRFAQYLEGSRDAVLSLKTSICRDARHDLVTNVTEGESTGRLFHEWSLLQAASSRYLDQFIGRISLGEPVHDEAAVHALLTMFAELASQGEGR
jgi:hypothetical protein